MAPASVYYSKGIVGAIYMCALGAKVLRLYVNSGHVITSDVPGDPNITMEGIRAFRGIFILQKA